MDSAIEVESCKPFNQELKMNDETVNTGGENEPVSKKLKISEEQVKLSPDKNDPQPGCSTSESTKSKVPKSKSNKQTPKKELHDSGSEGDMDVDDNKPPEEGFPYPIEMDSSDMLDEVEGFVDGEWPSVTERYFTPYYAIDVQSPGDDVCIRIHSNRICMLSLAPSHTILQKNKKIISCSYKVSEKLDRLQNKVSGKAKHGAQPLQNNSNICCLTCDDGSNYKIKCCLIGKLIEVNERLVENPELLKLDPELGGYIALALPNLRHFEKIKKSLLTTEQYKVAIKKRTEGTDDKEAQGSSQVTSHKQVSNTQTKIQSAPIELDKNGDAPAKKINDRAENDQITLIEKTIPQDHDMQMGTDM